MIGRFAPAIASLRRGSSFGELTTSVRFVEPSPGRKARRRQSAVLLPFVVAALIAGCATSIPPVVSSPRFPDYPFPAIPLDMAGTRAAEQHMQAWQFLQAGDLRTAQRRFTTVLQDAPGFYPAKTGLAYVELARQELRDAIAQFDGVLASAPAYVPALVGRGEALLASTRGDEALRDFEAALVADPSLSDVRRRVEILRFRSIQGAVSEGRAAVEAGRYDDAQAAFERAIAASPESPTLYRELASVEYGRGKLTEALAHASKAVELDPSDASGLALLGELYVAAGDLAEAERVLSGAYDLEPNVDLRRRLDDVRTRLRLARLPPEYAAISGASQITRGDLAALVGVQLEALLKSATLQQAGSGVVTDTRQHWAAPWILGVIRAGVMDAYPNHTFQPAATIRRGDLAEVVSRLLTLVARRAPGMAQRWRGSSLTFLDLSPGHLSYPAAAMAVSSGVLSVFEGNTFQPARPVSGTEAAAAVDRIEMLAARALQP